MAQQKRNDVRTTESFYTKTLSKWRLDYSHNLNLKIALTGPREYDYALPAYLCLAPAVPDWDLLELGSGGSGGQRSGLEGWYILSYSVGTVGVRSQVTIGTKCQSLK